MCFSGEVRIQTKNQAKTTNTAQSGAKEAGREDLGVGLAASWWQKHLTWGLALGERHKYIGKNQRKQKGIFLSFLFADKSGGTKLRLPRERREETQQRCQLGDIFRKKVNQPFVLSGKGLFHHRYGFPPSARAQ